MTQPNDPDNDGDNDTEPDNDDRPLGVGFLYGYGRISYNNSKHNSTHTPHHPSMKPSTHHKDRPPSIGRK